MVNTDYISSVQSQTFFFVILFEYKSLAVVVTPTLNVSREFSVWINFSTGYIKILQLKYFEWIIVYNNTRPYNQ